jgi:hypothetical protein
VGIFDRRRITLFAAPPSDEGGGGDETTSPGGQTHAANSSVKNGNNEHDGRKQVSLGLQYLYFLRFPLLGWICLPVLCGIDKFTGVSTITRGIMTMDRTWQAFYAAFFVAALMNTVLICAKNILRNGPCRFASGGSCTEDPPAAEEQGWLQRTLNDSKTSTVLWVLAVTHLPTVTTLLYLGIITHQEQETDFYLPGMGTAYWHLWVGFAVGLLISLVFWYGVSIFYLWVYPNWPKGDPRHREPAALLLPTGLPGMEQAQRALRPQVAIWADWTLRPLIMLSPDGYAKDRNAAAWEFHTLSVVALGWFLTLYLFLYPLTAPVVLSRRPWTATIVAGALGVVLWFGTCEADPKKQTERPAKNPGRVVVYAIRGVIGAALLVFLSLLWYDAARNTVLLENAFPVVASLLVILIFVQWLISGASFFFDRFRVPVVTAVLLLLFLSKLAMRWVDQENYFEARDTKRVVELDTPLEIMSKRMKLHDGEPYIIVTATGGGIQAAEWTAQVMAQMEKHFRDDPDMQKDGYTFHDHLLLASGVSGGSVGLMPYLLEYTTQIDAATGNPRPMFQTVNYQANSHGQVPADLLTRRLTLAPGCSSLEAVAWGLEYYDLERLLLTVPLLPNVADRSVQGEVPSEPDRTWALTQSFNRNFSDRDCGTDPQAQAEGEKFSALSEIGSGGTMTLRTAAHRVHAGLMPAFTFNTTAAETGGRFLLSNYRVSAVQSQACNGRCPQTIQGTEFLPAESFLQAYGMESNCDLPQIKSDCYADISLATAARLSATFPVVSSATRVPKRYATYAEHFVDGGYFDNDGTASVTEFLQSALQENAAQLQDQKQRHDPDQSQTSQKAPASNPKSESSDQEQPGKEIVATLPSGKLKILLLEIRDGDDMDPTQNNDDLQHQIGQALAKYAKQPTAWATSSQLLAPLEAMWGAGHESITRRNRRELCLLTQAYRDTLEVHHIVLGIPPAPIEGVAGRTKTPPLNWKLTAGQRQYIEEWATASDKPTQGTIAEALKWVKSSLPGGASPAQKEPVCTIYDQTYMRSDMR